MFRKFLAVCLSGVILVASIYGCTSTSADVAAPSAAQSTSSSKTSSLAAYSKSNSNSHTTSTPSSSSIPAGKKNALESAEQYLSFMAFSYSGLIDQLEYEGYSSEEAEYAAKNCGADWSEQAVLSAKQYLKTMSFSKDGLIEQLEYEGFTHEQATYGAEQAYQSSAETAPSAASGSVTTGEQNALQSATQYLNVMAFSYTGLIDQLTYEGYSDSEAKYAADHCGADWSEQAVKAAKQYLDIMSFSRQSLIDQLEYEGYAYDQASYAATQNGY